MVTIFMWGTDVERAAIWGEDGRVLCGSCLLAETPLLRLRGLLGRRPLARGEGLLLRPAGAVHTSFMRCPIDVVFLDKELRVLGVRERLAPWRTAGRRKARAVLELAAGEAAAWQLRAGERVRVVVPGSCGAENAAG